MTERLTERDEDGAVTLKYDIFAGVNNMVLRLAEYEDTGMTPEQIAEVLALRKKFEPPCYFPDGRDGCAYQCYDGQDEPIEKCKECPLCYSDKTRHYVV